jgi:hypothetical protein
MQEHAMKYLQKIVGIKYKISDRPLLQLSYHLKY